jgi:hypothetical protein
MRNNQPNHLKRAAAGQLVAGLTLRDAADVHVGAAMALRQVEYRGMTIKAGAFEVFGTRRFIACLSIARDGTPAALRKTKFFEPPSEDGLFDDPEEALESALAFAQAIIDGEVPGLTVDDL